MSDTHTTRGPNGEDLDQSDIPGRTACPNCHAQPTDDSRRKSHLSALGYRHDDQYLVCSACDTEWLCGVPLGASFAFADDLWCDSCDDAWLFVHRVIVPRNEGNDKVGLHYKCPNHGPVECPECGYNGEPRFEPAGIYCADDGCGHTFERDDLDGCYAFTQDFRRADEDGRVLIGYPQITGSLEDAEPYGWQRTDDPDGVVCGEPGCIQHGHGTLGCPLNESESA